MERTATRRQPSKIVMRVEFVILMALSLVMGVSLGFVGMRGFVAAVQTATSMPPIERALVQEGVTPEGQGSTSIGALVARLTIPRLRTEWFVVSATTPDALQGALGHVPGTAFPGDEGHCVIAGRYETPFQRSETRPGGRPHRGRGQQSAGPLPCHRDGPGVGDGRDDIPSV